MKLNNWPYITQAGVAARAFCFGSKTLLLSKEAVMRRKRESPAHFLTEPTHWQFQASGHRAAPAGGNPALLKHSVTWNCSGDTALHFTPELWAFQGFLFLPFYSFLPFYTLTVYDLRSRINSRGGRRQGELMTVQDKPCQILGPR